MSKRTNRVAHLDADIHALLTAQKLSIATIASLAIDSAYKNPENLGQALSLRLKRKKVVTEVKRTTISGVDDTFSKATELGEQSGLSMEQVLRLAIEAWLIHQGEINEFTGNLRVPRDREDKP